RNFSVSEVRERGVQSCLDETLEKLSACEVVYISLDVDSLDSEKISTGTGTPVPSGFYPKEVTELIKGLLASRKVVCLEVVEVNPLLDNQGNKMAEVAFQILEEAVGVLEGW